MSFVESIQIFIVGVSRGGRTHVGKFSRITGPIASSRIKSSNDKIVLV